MGSWDNRYVFGCLGKVFCMEMVFWRMIKIRSWSLHSSYGSLDHRLSSDIRIERHPNISQPTNGGHYL
jgi:hypothetical protein